ncbi:NUDIX hydrolase [Tropicimonas isoalkanivorans]|uniref:8-oxo-dGTP pyrophosphatase MutT, NUDIX family n=1 Tax=Tropicimonas isoalkanivorans TaxID=441112 RepID=A0A1I1M317_9RHOB|nr:NUDIX hydrolase [Tropicimonas isoalkanivorans]SFC79907.1 8-oxo-dGTP pyrophosphatase MutT, NUDIX family [Tropicimonas isoalkanivorans]
MIRPLHIIWQRFLRPMLQRPSGLQVAALCRREGASGPEVLLVSSRGTGRWIIPKGWPIRGLGSAEAALQEAWEEAGVRRGDADTEPCGTYTYHKRLAGGLAIPVETLVFPVRVKEMSDSYPEVRQRKRVWVSPKSAAEMVGEPELKQILLKLQS